MKKSTRIGTALVVVGGSIAATPSLALELGELRVESALGQPLRAAVAYALGPNEAILDSCVSLHYLSAGKPTVIEDSVRVANGVISISGGPVIREPVASLRLSVRCPYTPRLAREYTVFVDPPQRLGLPVEAPPPRVATRTRSSAAPGSRPAGRTADPGPSIPGARYQVQPGDSLSRIAQRVDGLTTSWREIADAIFLANPDAFMGNNPDRLKAGSWLTIPNAGEVAAAPRAAGNRDVQASPIVATAYEPELVPTSVAPEEPVPEYLDEIPDPVPLEPRHELRPGDLIIDSTFPAATAPIVAPDATATAPRDSFTIIQQPARRESQGVSWLVWLAGGAAVLLLGLWLFGRRLIDRFAARPAAPARAQPQMADETERAEAFDGMEPDYGDGPLIADDSPTAENPQLDADLFEGTGLSDSSDVAVASDFAFAATTGLDIELTEAMAAEPDEPETDIIPPINADESSILKSEVLPEDEDYDISVVLDATKMPDPNDVTERDLEAIELNDDEDALIPGDYTLSQEIDYKIREQEYRDEPTATQALNEEIRKAAKELANDLDELETTLKANSIDAHATVHDLDFTLQAPANDDDTDLDPTINAAAADDTVEQPGKDTSTG